MWFTIILLISIQTSSRLCGKNHYKLNGTCKLCSQQCYSRDSCQDNIGCTSCKSGYFLQNGECLKCNSTCLSCLNNLNCSSCKSAFFLENGTCQDCSKDCNYCSSNLNCTSCKNGYFVLNGTCQINSQIDEKSSNSIAIVLFLIGAILFIFIGTWIWSKYQSSPVDIDSNP